MANSFPMIGVGLIGAGRIGTSHAQILAERVPGARLAMVADPRPDAACPLPIASAPKLSSIRSN